MKAAVVSSFDEPPHFEDIAEPEATDEDEVVVDVLAAGLHPRVRSQADGSHYTSTDELPLVPGVDGVGRDPDGRLRYFVLPDTALGSMAERTVVDLRRSIVLPDDSNPVAIAAAMNPAMASWMALRRRITFEAGQDVLVLGATGSAGRMAVQTARRLGAGRIVAAGRDAARLAEVGATDAVTFDDPALGQLAGDVDVVLDFVWGEPSAAAMAAVITARPDRGKPLTWIAIGSVAGPAAPVPSAALRASRLQLVGSGQGSVDGRDFLEELPELVTEIAAGTFTVDAKAVPLRDIAAAWADEDSTERIVLVPVGP